MSLALDSALRRDLARAALSVAAASPWREATLSRLAEAAGRPVAELYGATLGEAADCVEEAFDRAIADNLDKLDAGQSVRDRLFELIMRRFEAMEPEHLSGGMAQVEQPRSGSTCATGAHS